MTIDNIFNRQIDIGPTVTNKGQLRIQNGGYFAQL